MPVISGVYYYALYYRDGTLKGYVTITAPYEWIARYCVEQLHPGYMYDMVMYFR